MCVYNDSKMKAARSRLLGYIHILCVKTIHKQAIEQIWKVWNPQSAHSELHVSVTSRIQH